ncbi:MAG: 2-hydroxyacyl-CoA dehydratase family protein [Peptococcaceae bacterium]|nr:2-hydroxyacyl-CoA dehydratase family protein [Peptococcaceae bacterium]
MENIVQTFGKTVQDVCDKNPERARKLLRIGYHAQSLRYRVQRGKMHSAAQLAALYTNRAMVAPLDHPDDAVIVSLFTPCEMLHVLGLHPFCSEGLGCYLSGACAEQSFLKYAESEGLPETFCSYHKAFIGASECGLMPKPRFIISTTLACDANTLTFRRLAEHFDVPHFVIDVPYEQDEDAVRYVADQLVRMKAFIEEHTGKSIDESALIKRCRLSQQSMDNFQRYMDLRADKQILGAISGEMYSAFMFHNLLGTEESLRYTEECLKVVEKAPAASGIRLLWMHTNPFWVKQLTDVTDFNPAVQIVGCDMCYEGFIHADPEKPYDFMARRLIFSAYNGPISRRVDRGIEEAQRLAADGVVWFCHWGCKHTLGGAQLAKRHFEEAGIPCLILDGDGCDRSHGGEGQLSTRIEAFIEMLEKEKEAAQA